MSIFIGQELENSAYKPIGGLYNSTRLLSYNGDFSWLPTGNQFLRIFNGTLTKDRTYTWPDKSGTVALLSDVSPSIYVNPFALSSLSI